MKPDYTTRMTRHTPKVVVAYDKHLGREKGVLIHAEPRCGATIAPGATTTLDAHVTCAACLALLEAGK